MKNILCQCHEKLVKDIKDFLTNVGDVKEESITDYLMWKWKEIDKRFKCIKNENLKTHTRHEEHHVTGADFDIELWIIGNTKTVPFAVQAKKFIKLHNFYVNKIKYPKNTSGQINKLLEYAKKENKIPVYFLYSMPFESKTRCRNHYKNSGVFVVSAHEMKEFSRLGKGKELALDTILDESHSLSCFFCHEPLDKMNEKEKIIFKYLLSDDKEEQIFYNQIPNYVQDISSGKTKNLNLPKEFRWIGVYDLRDKNLSMD